MNVVKKAGIIAAVVSTLATQAYGGWGLPTLPSAGAGVDLNALKERSDKVKQQVTDATVSLGEGTASVLKMGGKITQAEALLKQIQAMKGKVADLEQTKKMTESLIDIKSTLKGMVLDSSLAKSNAGSAVINLTKSIETNKKAVEDAQRLAKDVGAAVKTNPLASTELGEPLSTARYIAENGPKQISMGTEILSTLSGFVKAK